ncbi:MAG: ABC transporter ATP-binding protein [Spirochaetaceae bacterium]|nr:ABC transporter ATP-binding protein [Spirochaetaceae bacterium]
MFKISRYYIPYLGAIFLAIALLFLQVNMDLALPDYLSKIVNIGLQQNGIDSSIPKTLSSGTKNLLEVFLADSETEKFESAYTLYTLNETGRDLFENDASFKVDFLNSFLTVIFIEARQNGEPFLGNEKMGPLPDLEKLNQLPAEQRLETLENIKEKLSGSLDVKIKNQIGIQAVRYEYQLQGINQEKIQSSFILKTGGIMLLITIISAIATIIVGFIAARVSAGVARTLRLNLFKKIESFSSAEFDHFSTASLITRNTNDITQIQTVSFMIIRMVLFAPIMAIGGVIRAYNKAPSLAWIIALAVLVLMGLVAVNMSIALPKFKAIQGLIDKVNKVAREQLTGLLVVRAFNRQDFEKDRFDIANSDLTKINLFVTRVMVLLMPVIMLIMNVLSLAIIWFGAKQIAASTMQVGDMMAFLQYAMQIVMAFLMLSMSFIFIPRASVSADRISEVLKTEGSVKNFQSPAILPENTKGLIEFKNVSFKYPGADDMALKEISFFAVPGETTAIIGSTGSGKSSLINLIPRFYDVLAGEILIDGYNIKDLDIHDLRSNIGYVPQKSILFAGTIESNLSYGTEGLSREQISKAVEISQARDFIDGRAEGYNSAISQSGANVSGGQKQRLSIARALVHNYPILIFDDSFSALDYKTDADLRKDLEREFTHTTRIIVAQRVSTIMQAQQILVLDEGRLVGRGRHKQLMDTCETYREIVLSQLSVKEAQ